MKNYEFNTTASIADTFEEHGCKFHVISLNGQEELLAGFSVNSGPAVVMRFISVRNDRAVAARIFNLVSDIPVEKRASIMEVCNTLNLKYRFMKHYLTPDGDINVEYDFPSASNNEYIGEMAFEIFARAKLILDEEYGTFMKALYTDEPTATESKANLIDFLHFLASMNEANDPDADISEENS